MATENQTVQRQYRPIVILKLVTRAIKDFHAVLNMDIQGTKPQLHFKLIAIKHYVSYETLKPERERERETKKAASFTISGTQQIQRQR